MPLFCSAYKHEQTQEEELNQMQCGKVSENWQNAHETRFLNAFSRSEQLMKNE